MTESPRGLSGWLYSSPISPFRLWSNVPSSTPSSDQTLGHPEGRTAATNSGEDDEWSDEYIERLLEKDRLDPKLDEWVRATLGE